MRFAVEFTSALLELAFSYVLLGIAHIQLSFAKAYYAMACFIFDLRNRFESREVIIMVISFCLPLIFIIWFVFFRSVG